MPPPRLLACAATTVINRSPGRGAIVSDNIVIFPFISLLAAVSRASWAHDTTIARHLGWPGLGNKLESTILKQLRRIAIIGGSNLRTRREQIEKRASKRARRVTHSHKHYSERRVLNSAKGALSSTISIPQNRPVDIKKYPTR